MLQNSIFFIVVLFGATPTSFAEGIELLAGQDISTDVGAMVGTVSSSEIQKGASIPFGGAVVGVTFNKDFSNNLSGYVQPQVAIDANTQSVLKQGLNAGMAWHLVGGARKRISSVHGVRFDEENSKNLSLIFRTGYVNFNAKPAKIGAKPLKGALIENVTGFEYRHDVFEESALGMRILKSIIAFPTSVENVSTDFLEITMFWRKVL